MTTKESILEEAQRLTHGDRGKAYGPPHEDYGKVAQMFNALIGAKLKEPLTAMDMALAMCCVKLSRQAHRWTRDNMVDLAGYAWVADECAQILPKKESPEADRLCACKLFRSPRWPVQDGDTSHSPAECTNTKARASSFAI
jgi:hypothetical protein